MAYPLRVPRVLASGKTTTYRNGTNTYTRLVWKQGRQLTALYTGGKAISYTYDADGIRMGKKVGTTTHTYITQNGKVMRETIGTGSTAKVLDFIYDNQGRPLALRYSENSGISFETYYYVLNLQGDVVKLVEIVPGIIFSTVAEYSYDAWGNVISATGSMAEINPLRYRGYYYDTETGFYYLQSRYYDPAIHRFINADALASTGQGFLGCSMFAYCNNNPIKSIDISGCVCIENHPIQEHTDGFSMEVSEDFLNPYYCLFYAYEIVLANGHAGEYYGMDPDRIAKEIYAHAVLYEAGRDFCSNYSESSPSTSYADTTLPITISASVFNRLFYKFGNWLMDRGGNIFVNEDEAWHREVVYDYLWYSNTTNYGRAYAK